MQAPTGITVKSKSRSIEVDWPDASTLSPEMKTAIEQPHNTTRTVRKCEGLLAGVDYSG